MTKTGEEGPDSILDEEAGDLLDPLNQESIQWLCQLSIHVRVRVLYHYGFIYSRYSYQQ